MASGQPWNALSVFGWREGSRGPLLSGQVRAAESHTLAWGPLPCLHRCNGGLQPSGEQSHGLTQSHASLYGLTWISLLFFVILTLRFTGYREANGNFLEALTFWCSLILKPCYFCWTLKVITLIPLMVYLCFMLRWGIIAIQDHVHYQKKKNDTVSTKNTAY